MASEAEGCDYGVTALAALSHDSQVITRQGDPRKPGTSAHIPLCMHHSSRLCVCVPVCVSECVCVRARVANPV